MSTRLALLGIVVAFVATLTGCGQSGPPTYKVTGTVKFEDGTPLTKGTIMFDSGEVSAKGAVSEDGTFILGTTDAGNGAQDGQYAVYFTGPAATEKLVAEEFCNGEKTPLSYKVEKRANVFEIEVKRPE
ncbi:MAG: hypothetical protein ACI9G1_003764 [Pirellulaceae bacterium]|jgi:hypothetical protein